MVNKEKIRKIREVLEKHKKLSYNKFKEIVVEKKGLMAAQTFSDGLKEAVDSGIIRREEGQEKRKMVWYSIPEIAIKEDLYYGLLSSDITSFQQSFEQLDHLFSELKDVEKGQILFSFLDWYFTIQSQIAMGHSMFRSPKFVDMSKFMDSYLQGLDKLSMSGDEKQQSVIWNELFMGWFDVKAENLDIIDDLLDIATARQAR